MVSPESAAPDGAALALRTLVRPGYLATLFLAGWAANVLLLARRRVDYGSALGLAREELPTAVRLLALAGLAAVVLGSAQAAVALYGPSSMGLVSLLLIYATVAWALLGDLPPWLARRAPPARAAFARALRRCFWPDPAKETPFAQVLVADGLTSLARALFDLAQGSCAAVQATRVAPGTAGSLLGDALEQCGRSPLPFLAWAAPFLVRARQCWLSSRHAPDPVSRRLHLLNLAKYLTALPIVCLAFLRAQASEGDDVEALEMLGALAGVVNTVFSYLWDLAMDWGLLHPAPPLSGRFGLRPVLLLCEGGGFYYLAIAADAVARACWSLRWCPEAVALGGFWLGSLQQAVEVARRCLWSTLRVEWQCVRAGGQRLEVRAPPLKVCIETAAAA